ncbi:MAG: HAD family phosphatase [Blastocatellia bacterium]|nr:HAD family phosphatase [Blastocatellia bacterium]
MNTILSSQSSNPILSTVLLDYGQVLCLPQPETDLRALAHQCGTSDLERFSTAYYEPRHEYDRGTLDGPTYWQLVCEQLGTSLPDPLCEQLIALDNQSWAYANIEMSNWVAAVQRQGIRTAILSNMPLDMRKDFDRYTPWLPPIPEKFFSCDFQRIKPEPEIFEICLAALGIAPETVLFVDDRPANVATARSLGITTIRFESTEQFFREVHTISIQSP